MAARADRIAFTATRSWFFIAALNAVCIAERNGAAVLEPIDAT
jgi:hypothetical protein